MISTINLDFFNNHDFQKKVIVNFLGYMDSIKESSEICFVKTIHEGSAFYFDIQPLFNDIKSLQNHFIKEMKFLIENYEDYFSEFSLEIDYRSKIILYSNLTDAKKEINFILEDIKYSQDNANSVHVYHYQDIYDLFESYCKYISKGFSHLKEIYNLSETVYLYKPSLDFYENEFKSLEKAIFSKLEQTDPSLKKN